MHRRLEANRPLRGPAPQDAIRRWALRVAALIFALGAAALGSDGRSQAASPCAQACQDRAEASRARCGTDAGCRQRENFAERRCVLACDTSMGPVARCREECDIHSDECDARCQEESDDGARRGCLRRCGSLYHVRCPRECDRVPGSFEGPGDDPPAGS